MKIHENVIFLHSPSFSTNKTFIVADNSKKTRTKYASKHYIYRLSSKFGEVLSKVPIIQKLFQFTIRWFSRQEVEESARANDGINAEVGFEMERLN